MGEQRDDHEGQDRVNAKVREIIEEATRPHRRPTMKEADAMRDELAALTQQLETAEGDVADRTRERDEAMGLLCRLFSQLTHRPKPSDPGLARETVATVTAWAEAAADAATVEAPK